MSVYGAISASLGQACQFPRNATRRLSFPAVPGFVGGGAGVGAGLIPTGDDGAIGARRMGDFLVWYDVIEDRSGGSGA